METISEYAKRAGISPRAVRFQVTEGRIAARKVGNRWMIEHAHRTPTRGAGRRLSARSFDDLAAFCDDDLEDLSHDQRRRAKERAHKIAELGVDQLRRYAERPPLNVERFRASEEDLEELRSRTDLALTGISHPFAEVYGHVLDAYVTRDVRDELVLFHMLEPAEAEATNVVLRQQDRVPEVRRLHVIADLLDDPSPRSRAEASRLLALVLSEAR